MTSAASYDLLSSALLYEVKLVLLWFGAWKNGAMEYTPRWVKTNPQRFRRVQTPLGGDTWVLSSHCQANWEADCRAYTALCRFLKEKDSERKVIAIQIENEPGILGSDRDYGAEGQADFERPVPSDLLAKMRAAGQGRVHDLWQAAGGAESGSWAQVFGRDGGELMTAYSIATYIDRLAEAGKAILDVPMYVNVWLGEGGWRIPGETYPSGGAVAKVLDIYRWCAPHIDLIAPDIYIADSRGYEAMCAAYSRRRITRSLSRNRRRAGPMPGTCSAPSPTIDAIGYAFFAAEQVLAEDGSVRPEARMLVESFQSVAAALPLILQYQGTGRMHAIVQEENQAAQTLDLEGYIGAGAVWRGRGAGRQGLASSHQAAGCRKHARAGIGHPGQPPRVLPDRGELPPVVAPAVASGANVRHATLERAAAGAAGALCLGRGRTLRGGCVCRGSGAQWRRD